MSRSSVIAMLVLFALCPVLAGQVCNDMTLRGTYCLTCNAWIDLSKLGIPGAPAGYVPSSYVGVLKIDGAGRGSGWLAANLGGMQLSLAFVNLTYKVKDDCTVESTYSLKVKELGTTIGPDTRILVVIPGGRDLEMRGLNVGKGPGDKVDPCELKRMSPTI